MEIRIPVLVRFLNQHHRKHPDPSVLFKDHKLLLKFADEYPEAITKTEEFLSMQKNSIVKWLNGPFTF
jgi:hypothetical protein